MLRLHFVSLGVCLALLVGLIRCDHDENIKVDAARLERFKKCIQRCSEADSRCNDLVKDMWIDFLKNKKVITRHLKRCCLRNELREDASPEDSFATCARINCGAVLWGCQIVKKHSGFLSQDELEHLKEGNHTA